MSTPLFSDKVAEIFVKADDFCKLLYIPDHVDPSFSFAWTHHSCHGDPPFVKGLFCHQFW